jgi:inner membrane protein
MTSPETCPPPALPVPPRRVRSPVVSNLLLIGLIVTLFQVPLLFVNRLRQERHTNRKEAVERTPAMAPRIVQAVDGYRMVERALKHNILVMALVFAAFFLFETLVRLRLHPVHYGLVGAALSLFYLALLATGEVLPAGWAYLAAAVPSSLLVSLYSAAVLRSWMRAGLMAALLAGIHGVLYVVLRMEDLALLAGTGALFAALGAIMYFTRNVDWWAREGQLVEAGR